MAKPRVGEDALAIAIRERSGRLTANRRLQALVDWYKGVRADYAK